MLPVQISHEVLAELALALDAIASTLAANVVATDADVGVVALPRHGFAATPAADETGGPRASHGLRVRSARG